MLTRKRRNEMKERLLASPYSRPSIIESLQMLSDLDEKDAQITQLKNILEDSIHVGDLSVGYSRGKLSISGIVISLVEH